MISVDAILVELVKENFVTISSLLVFLKIIASETKSTVDDKVVTLLMNLFRKQKPEK